MKLHLQAFVALFFLTLSAPLHAQPDPRDADIFGKAEDEGEEDAPAVDPAVLDRLDAKAGEREEALFGGEYEGTELSDREFELLTNEKLQFGGFLYFRYAVTGYDDLDVEPTTAMPNLLDLYADGRPNDRVRGFVKGRLKFDPITTRAMPALSDKDLATLQGVLDSGVLPAEQEAGLRALTEPPDKSKALLDQFWLKFDIGRQLYVTAGKQPIHWGTTRIWNPVDVVNSTRREPLALFDERTGVTALKLHVPIEKLSWNVIGLVLLDDADTFDKVGGALRFETVFSTVEMGLSGMVKQEAQVDGSDLLVPKVGLDLSAGIWDFDVTLEGSASFEDATRRGNYELGDRDVLLQLSAGLAYTWKYSAEDSLYAGVEYFFNPDGYDHDDVHDHDAYLGAFAGGGFSPFYLGRHYGAFYLSLPSPGSWDYTSFTLSNIGNLSDRSFTTRFDYSVTVLTYLAIQAYAFVTYGEEGGEFRFSLPADSFYPGFSGTPAARYNLGLNLRINI